MQSINLDVSGVRAAQQERQRQLLRWEKALTLPVRWASKSRKPYLFAQGIQYCCYQKYSKRDGFDGIIIISGEGAWEPGIEALVIILQVSGARWVDDASIRSFKQRVSDLQFMLHHVEGVVGEVDFLDAVDNLLLRLRVNGLLPHLPQLLLKWWWDRDRQRQTEIERHLKMFFK